MWLKQVSGREQCLTFIAEKIFCQVLEQPGQPRGAEQAGQGVPDKAVLSVLIYLYLLLYISFSSCKVCQTQQFFQYAIVSDSVIDPTHHPCLHSLPNIFFKAMQGVSAMVDAYLGERELFLQKCLGLFGTLLNVNELIH